MYCDNEKTTRAQILKVIGVGDANLSVPKYTACCGLSFTQAQVNNLLFLLHDPKICQIIHVDMHDVSNFVYVFFRMPVCDELKLKQMSLENTFLKLTNSVQWSCSKKFSFVIKVQYFGSSIF